MEYCQCNICGTIHKEDLKKCVTEDDIYVYVECPKCRGVTKHLMCGDKPEDVYIYSDPVMDERYYNTK